jgi:hypothetical protein
MYKRNNIEINKKIEEIKKENAQYDPNQDNISRMLDQNGEPICIYRSTSNDLNSN